MAFLAQMEHVLDVYERPYTPEEPVLCLDETPVFLRRDARPSQPARPGQAARQDYEYVRAGRANLFVAVEPLAGQRVLRVTAQRTKVDFAQFVRTLLEEHYPNAKRVHLVLDNLNTHTLASFYETFPAAEARAMRRRVQLHFTPKHASWLNMAEIELSAVARQILRDRIPDQPTLAARIAACEAQRNARRATIQWRFTSEQAHDKFARFYPS